MMSRLSMSPTGFHTEPSLAWKACKAKASSQAGREVVPGWLSTGSTARSLSKWWGMASGAVLTKGRPGSGSITIPSPEETKPVGQPVLTRMTQDEWPAFPWTVRPVGQRTGPTGRVLPTMDETGILGVTPGTRSPMSFMRPPWGIRSINWRFHDNPSAWFLCQQAQAVQSTSDC